MFAFTGFSRFTQRAVCMLLAAAIVTASVALGALAMQPELHATYSVTVTQLQ